MNGHILICGECHSYTLHKSCKSCGSPTFTPHPPRFSPEDRYGEYRRKLIALTRKGE